MKSKLIILFLLLSCIFQNANAQEPVVNLGAIAGVNLAELNMNSNQMFFGLNAGLTGTVRITKHWQFASELLFSQNAEHILPNSYPDIPYKQVRLNHVEVPMHVDFLFDKSKTGSFYAHYVGLGVAYAKLIGHKVIDEYGGDISEQIVYGKMDNVIPQITANFRWNEHYSFDFRTAFALNKELGITLSWRFVYWL